MKSTSDAGTTTSYGYDGDGVRLQAVSGASTTNYRWDVNAPLPQLALERDGAGTVLRSYLHGLRPLALQTGTQSSYFHVDGLGSVLNLTSGTGATQWTYGYEPFGLAKTATKNDPAGPDNYLRFAGEYLDSTALYHLRARQYDPANGRFLALDPLRRSLRQPAIASYAYADNRPTVFVDPSGLGPIWSDGRDETCSSFRCYLTDSATPGDLIKRGTAVGTGLAVTAFGFHTMLTGGGVMVGCIATTKGLYALACQAAGAKIVGGGAMIVVGGFYLIEIGLDVSPAVPLDPKPKQVRRLGPT